MRSIEIVTGVCVVLGAMACSSSDALPPTQPLQDSSAADSTVVPPDSSTSDASALSDAVADSNANGAAEEGAADAATDVVIVSDAVATDAVATDAVTTDATAPDAIARDATIADAITTDATADDARVIDAAIADTITIDQGADASSVPSCGDPPYQLFNPVGFAPYSGFLQPDVVVSSNICPATTVNVPFMGTRTMNVQKGVPLFFIATQEGSLTNLSREYKITSSAYAQYPLWPEIAPAAYAMRIDPTWDGTTKALLFVRVNAVAGTGICHAKDGVMYTVPNHPEAIIKYTGGGTSTASGGDANAWISLVTTGTVAAPEYVTITQTKPGCKVELSAADKLIFTGRAPIAINAITMDLEGDVMDP